MNRLNKILLNSIINKSHLINNNRRLYKNIIYSSTTTLYNSSSSSISTSNNNINNKFNKFNNKSFTTSTTSDNSNNNKNNNNNNNNNNNSDNNSSTNNNNNLKQDNNNINEEEFNKELQDKIQVTINLFNQDISKDLTNPINYMNRGTIYQFNKQFDEATKDFNKVLELTKPSNQLPNDNENFDLRNRAYYGLAVIQTSLNDYDKAIEIIDKSFKENTVSVVQIVLKADCYMKKSNYFGAQHCFALAFKSMDKDSQDIQVRQLSYKITELMVDCYTRMLENLSSTSPSSLETIQSILNIEIPSNKIETIIKSETKSFNQLNEKSKELVMHLDQLMKSPSTLDQIKKDNTTKQLFECLVSFYMAITYSSMEAMKLINNKDYNNINIQKVDSYLLKCFEKSLKEFFNK